MGVVAARSDFKELSHSSTAPGSTSGPVQFFLAALPLAEAVAADSDPSDEPAADVELEGKLSNRLSEEGGHNGCHASFEAALLVAAVSGVSAAPNSSELRQAKKCVS